jgi:hypothetical protein
MKRRFWSLLSHGHNSLFSFNRIHHWSEKIVLSLTSSDQKLSLSNFLFVSQESWIFSEK